MTMKTKRKVFLAMNTLIRIKEWLLDKLKNDPYVVLLGFLCLMIFLAAVMVPAKSDDVEAAKERLRQREKEYRQQRARDMMKATINFVFEVRKIEQGYEVKIKELKQDEHSGVNE